MRGARERVRSVCEREGEGKRYGEKKGVLRKGETEPM